jgi:hypothetical protein
MSDVDDPRPGAPAADAKSSGPGVLLVPAEAKKEWARLAARAPQPQPQPRDDGAPERARAVKRAESTRDVLPSGNLLLRVPTPEALSSAVEEPGETLALPARPWGDPKTRRRWWVFASLLLAAILVVAFVVANPTTSFAAVAAALFVSLRGAVLANRDQRLVPSEGPSRASLRRPSDRA